MKVEVYSNKGAKHGTAELSEEVFAYPWNADLVHQVIHSQMSNQRANTAHTKDRSEVSGGGKKPWAQKGTGRARHGSSRSPIWRHGGVTHGPRSDRNYKETIPRGMKARALYAILSQKVRDGKVLFIDSINLPEGKTKDAAETMKSFTNVEGFKTINWAKLNNAIIYTPTFDRRTHLAFRNLENATIVNMDQMNPLTISNTRYIVVVNPSAINDYLVAKSVKQA